MISNFNLLGSTKENEKRKCHTAGKSSNSNLKIAHRCKIDTPTTHIRDHSLSLVGTGILIKSGCVKLVGTFEP